jgi:hypothetical protein
MGSKLSALIDDAKFVVAPPLTMGSLGRLPAPPPVAVLLPPAGAVCPEVALLDPEVVGADVLLESPCGAACEGVGALGLPAGMTVVLVTTASGVGAAATMAPLDASSFGASPDAAGALPATGAAGAPLASAFLIVMFLILFFVVRVPAAAAGAAAPAV